MPKKILLVDHDLPMCHVLRQQLEDNGYDTVVAPDGGDEGIFMAVTEAPDLILIAANLPVIDGWQTIEILKGATVTQDIPIIVMLEPATNLEQSRIADSDCDDYELKPIAIDSILEKIEALLTPSQAADPRRSKLQKRLSKQQEISQLAAPEASTVTKPMVVYVDDSPADSQVMAEIVRAAGYGYNNISEPLDAIPRLLELKPQLIFLDLVMPYTNGYELCAQIRRISGFKKTPIIIVTNNDGIIDRFRALFMVGASGFFSKPVKEERVLKVLEKYLAPISIAALGDISRSGLLV